MGKYKKTQLTDEKISSELTQRKMIKCHNDKR